MTSLRSLIFMLAVWLMTTASTQIPLPVEVREGAISVRAERGLESIAKEVASEAPAMLADIATDLPGLPSPATIEIRLVHRSSSLPLVAPPGRGAPHWASGVAYASAGVVTIARANDTELNDVLSVTAHELAHLALDAALAGQAPRWLNEGFAYLHSSSWSMARTQVLTQLAWSGNTIPFPELEHYFPQDVNEVNKAYAQSYDMVSFLARRGRYSDKKDDGDPWPFRNFLKAIAQGESLDDAALHAYATPMKDLYEEWFEDLKGRYMTLPASLFGLLVWAFAALLLIVGYLRKRRKNRATLAIWEEEERAREEELQAALQQSLT